MLRCSIPYITLAWLRLPVLPRLFWFMIYYTRAVGAIVSVYLGRLKTSTYLLSGLPSATPSPVHQRSGRNYTQCVEGEFAGVISCLRYHLAKCPEGLRVPPHSSLVTIPTRRQERARSGIVG